MQTTLPGTLEGASPWHAMDARWKLAGVLACCVSIALLRDLAAAGVALALALTVVAVARMPWRWWVGQLGGVALFLGLCLFVLPFSLPETDLAVGPLRLSSRGLELAFLIAAKALAVVSLTLLLLATAPVEVTLKAAHALRVPNLLVLLASLTYRYVNLFHEDLGKLRVALRVRGFRNRASWQTFRTLGQVTGTLLVRGVEQGERVAQAMRCRGFDGRLRLLHQFRTRASDGVLFGILALVGALPWLVEWACRS
jgi:cobalt/nickel transport system permease protein